MELREVGATCERHLLGRRSRHVTAQAQFACALAATHPHCVARLVGSVLRATAVPQSSLCDADWRLPVGGGANLIASSSFAQRMSGAMRWVRIALLLAAIATGIVTLRRLHHQLYLKDALNPVCSIPYGSTDFVNGNETCYQTSIHGVTKGCLELHELGQPDNVSILASFEKNHARGFSLIDLPTSDVMPIMRSIKASEVVTLYDLSGFGMAVQRSIQRELNEMGRSNWIAIASGTQCRATARTKSQGRTMGKLELVHIDFSRNATLRTLLNNPGAIRPTLQFRLATSPIFRRLDEAFGTGNVEAAHEFLELKHTLNVWAPVVDVVTSDPLAMMSAESLCDGQAKECKINSGCDLRSSVLRSQVVCRAADATSNTWFWKRKMTFGQAFVFDSRRTPHSSVPIGKGVRRSVEVRVLILKPKDEFEYHGSWLPRKMIKQRRYGREYRPCWTIPMLQGAREVVKALHYDEVRLDSAFGDDTQLLERALRMLARERFPRHCA